MSAQWYSKTNCLYLPEGNAASEEAPDILGPVVAVSQKRMVYVKRTKGLENVEMGHSGMSKV
jgi:hypothetical protein